MGLFGKKKPDVTADMARFFSSGKQYTVTEHMDFQEYRVAKAFWELVVSEARSASIKSGDLKKMNDLRSLEKILTDLRVDSLTEGQVDTILAEIKVRLDLPSYQLVGRMYDADTLRMLDRAFKKLKNA